MTAERVEIESPIPEDVRRLLNILNLTSA